MSLMVLEEDFQSFSQVISLWELYVSPYLMRLYMKFHHIWLTDIRYIFTFSKQAFNESLGFCNHS